MTRRNTTRDPALPKVSFSRSPTNIQVLSVFSCWTFSLKFDFLENPTSKKKESSSSSSNYSPPEKIPRLEFSEKDRESPKGKFEKESKNKKNFEKSDHFQISEPKLVVPLKIKLGGGIKSEKPVEVAQKEPETLKVAEKKEERIVPKLKLLTGFGIPAQVVTSVSNSNEVWHMGCVKIELPVVITHLPPLLVCSCHSVLEWSFYKLSDNYKSP